MNLLIKTLAAVAVCTVFAIGAFAQSAVVPIDNEPAPASDGQKATLRPIGRIASDNFNGLQGRGLERQIGV